MVLLDIDSLFSFMVVAGCIMVVVAIVGYRLNSD